MTLNFGRLPMFSLLALTLLGCPSEGDNGNLEFEDTNGNSWNFNRQITPMATGSTVVFEVNDAADGAAAVQVDTVTSSDTSVVSVDETSGSLVTITGLQAGQSTLNVSTTSNIDDSITVDVVDAADFRVELATPSWVPLYISPADQFSVLAGTSLSAFATPLATNETELAGFGAESWLLALEDGTEVTPDTAVGDWSITPESGGSARVTVGHDSANLRVLGGGESELTIPVISLDNNDLDIVSFGPLTPSTAQIGEEVLIVPDLRDYEGNYMLAGDTASITISEGSEFATLQSDSEYFDTLGGRGDFAAYILTGTDVGVVTLTLTYDTSTVATTVTIVPAAEPEE